MDRYKVEWYTSHGMKQSTIVSANSAAEAKAKAKSGRPQGECKNMTAYKLK